MRRIALLYNDPGAGASEADADVLVQVEAVLQAMRTTGNPVTPIAVSLDLAALDDALSRIRPTIAINLVEALGGTDRLATLVPQLLDARRIPYTGVGADALAALTDKVAAKRALRAAGLATPDWYLPGELFPGPGAYIIKARYEHASIGMDSDSVLRAGEASHLDCAAAKRSARFGTAFFAERFVPGREFNLALLSEADGVETLPPAEIDFSGLPAGEPSIVGWNAKWVPDSIEYNTTPRRLTFSGDDAALLRELGQLARSAWDAFGLRGYARVDFRVDASGQPWILEVNGNPCLSPDAGFAASLAHARIPFEQAVERLLGAAAHD
jgi:D-alanine-D-alanine ligase